MLIYFNGILLLALSAKLPKFQLVSDCYNDEHVYNRLCYALLLAAKTVIAVLMLSLNKCALKARPCLVT